MPPTSASSRLGDTWQTVLSDLALRCSWSGYHPSALLWRFSHWHTKDCFATVANLTSDNGIPNFQWDSFIPPMYRTAWIHLLKCFATGAPNPEKDAALRDVLPLFHNPGIQLPFRLLTDQEVLQVSGLSQNFGNIVHLRHLLTSYTIRSYVGNSFHPKLVSLALGSAEDLQAWVQGKLPSVTKVADPTTVRKYYLRLKQEISNTFARNNYTPKSELVAEPYRHHDYRSIVMSPIEAPKVAQPTVGNILPAYLTKEVIQNDLKKDAEARMRVLGMPQLLRFFEDSQLAQHAQQIAVPQWVPFTSNVADSLTQGSSLLLLPAYARGLFAQPTFSRAILFCKSLVASSTAEKDGFFVISYRHLPCQIHHIGSHKPENIYLVQFRDSLDILLFKYGGQPVQICPGAVHRKEYIARYSYCTTLVTEAEACVVGLAAQRNSNVVIAEAPFSRAFSETGCALWRLAQNAAAKADWLQAQSGINHCHRELERLPLVLIEGYFENSRLSVCLSTAIALCAQEQAELWAAHDPAELCILFICQATHSQPAQEFHYLVTIAAGERFAPLVLPTADSATVSSKNLFLATPIDNCPNLAVENGWYVCIAEMQLALCFGELKLSSPRRDTPRYITSQYPPPCTTNPLGWTPGCFVALYKRILWQNTHASLLPAFSCSLRLSQTSLLTYPSWRLPRAVWFPSYCPR